MSEGDVYMTNNPFTTEEVKALPFDLPKDAPPRFFATDLDENALRAAFSKNKTEGCYAIAAHIVKKYNIVTVGTKEYEMFVYQNGYYTQATNEIIYPEIQLVLGPKTTLSAKREIFGLIASMTIKRRDVFTTASLDLIPLINGVYDRSTKTLLPHSPDYKFTIQFPIIYDANATCPLTSTFLDQVFDENQRTVVEEWLGYYFYRNYQFKKAIIFVGEGDTGKTTVLQVINNLIGLQNISGISLQKMATDKFAAAQMFAKHANIWDDLDSKDISGTGNFKIATGGGTISGEYKFGNQFMFVNFAKLTFACNKIPDVKDFNDPAYFLRWLVVRFERPIEKKIPNLIKTLTTDAERSGLFNLAMQGLDRLLEQSAFSYDKTPLDTQREMMRSGSSIAQFAAEKLEQENGAQISKEELYDIYSQFCADNGAPAETIQMFGKKILFYTPYMTEGLLTTTSSLMGKSRPRGWRNVVVRADKSAPDPFDEYQKTTV